MTVFFTLYNNFIWWILLNINYLIITVSVASYVCLMHVVYYSILNIDSNKIYNILQAGITPQDLGREWLINLKCMSCIPEWLLLWWSRDMKASECVCCMRTHIYYQYALDIIHKIDAVIKHHQHVFIIVFYTQIKMILLEKIIPVSVAE